MSIKKMIDRHIRSEGFQRRWSNIYWPFIKRWGARPYNVLHNVIFSRWYQKQFTSGEAADAAQEIAETQYDNSSINVRGTNRVLRQEDAFEQVRGYLVNHERQDFGMCVTHTVKNIYRVAAKIIFNAEIDFSEHDIYLDRTTRYKDIDAGMSSSKTLARVAQKGVAIDGVVPDPKTESDLQLTRDDYPDDQVAPFRITLHKNYEFINGVRNFDAVWNFITQTYATQGVRPFQLSITAMRGWWVSDVPTATGTVYGGHSVVGLTIPFIYNGQRAFFCIDSSFRNGLVWQVARGVRIVTEDCWQGLGRAIRPVEFIDQVEAAIRVNQKLIVPNVPTNVNQLTVGAGFGQNNEHVSDIQRALISLGYDIPAITSGDAQYGYYGQQTADAVMAFHLDNAGRFFSIDSRWDYNALRALRGKSFGNLSVQVANDLLRGA